MIKLEINCCFEQRQQSAGTPQDECGKEEVCLSAAGGRQGREFEKKEKCIIRSWPSSLPTWKFTLNNLTQEMLKKKQDAKKF